MLIISYIAVLSYYFRILENIVLLPVEHAMCAEARIKQKAMNENHLLFA